MQKKIWKWFPPNYPLVFSVMDFPDGSVRNLPAMQETWVQSLGWEDLEKGHGNLLPYSCLENLLDRGANFCLLK